jgi:hypothetical protein
MRKIRKVLCLAVLLASATAAQDFSEVTSWRMQDSAVVGSTSGTVISTSSYNASSWYSATVPGTVLQTLVNNGVYTNPDSALNMYSIPDLANQQKRYWFYSSFRVIRADATRSVWLEIPGINYYATIFVNGSQVGTMFGAFKEGKFNITSLVPVGTSTNYVAVKIRGNYVPGTYHTNQTNCNGTNGGTMTQDGPTFIATQGWDWINTIPDRSMGIWKPVYVRVTGPVAIRHPWIRTTGVSTSSATVPLQVMLRNATGTAVTGTVTANIDGTLNFTTPAAVTVPANDTLNVTFTSLTMTSPQLWWPNGYGDPNLYTCNVTFTPNTGTVSDTVTFKFGVRQWAFSTNTSGYFILSCNGQRILTRGGNWGMDDCMKRRNLHKLENMVRYHKEMNFNMIRDWLGGTDCEELYDFCDKYGLIVWADFWEPHSSDGPTPATDQTNYLANMRDKIYRVRNHASVAIWCERNETTPTPAFLTALTNYHTELDGTRKVQASSGLGDVHSGGPYTYTSPAGAYSAVTGFHTEFGGPTPMSYESMRKIMPDAQTYAVASSNTYWSFHDFCYGNGYPDNFRTAMTTLYGTAPTNGAACGLRSQLMNYDDYRAPFEALQVKRFVGSTGLLLWMSNCVHPSTMWQTYDYYMEGTGAMYGSMKGAEPVHIMYYGTGTFYVSVVNNTRSALSGYTAYAATYNLNGTRAWADTATAVGIAADAANTNVLGNGITAGSSTPYFLDLKLKDGSGNLVSHNFYWIPNSGTNISGMLTMTSAPVAATTTPMWTKIGVENTITFKLANTAAVCAVACRIQVTQGSPTGTRVLPIHYNDNYFSLIPGDTQNITIKFDDVDLAGAQPYVCITGVNVPQICITPSAVLTPRRGTQEIVGEIKTYVSFAGSRLNVHNLAAGAAWQVRMYDMRGRVVLDRSGVSDGTDAFVSTGRLVPGAYVAMVNAGGKQLQTLFSVLGTRTAAGR